MQTPTLSPNPTATPFLGRGVDINPADFQHLGDFYQGDSEAWWDVYTDDHRALEATMAEVLGIDHGQPVPWEAAWRRCGCDHCGTRYNHGALFLHTPTGTLVRVGQTCAANTFRHADRAALAQHRLARAHQRAEERLAIAAKRQEWIDANPDVYAHLTKFADGNQFYTDLLAKLERWGSLSENQAAAVLRNVERDHERAAQRAERDAADAAAIAAGVTCPEGRVTIVGTVISTKWQDNDFGGRQVMTVAADDGYRVWGTVPSAINPEVGDRITFAAQVTRSDRDPLFGFYKRPTRAQVLATA